MCIKYFVAIYCKTARFGALELSPVYTTPVLEPAVEKPTAGHNILYKPTMYIYFKWKYQKNKNNDMSFIIYSTSPAINRVQLK